jgi:Secretion system C-terminal sorting domain
LKKLFVILYFSSLTFSLKAQTNLVLNWSFEQDSTCLLNIYTCDRSGLIDWYNPTPGATPDWLDSTCFGNSGNWGVPQNYAGWQYAKSGVSYVGLSFADLTYNYREYVMGTLSDSLNRSNKYCVEFFVSLADSLWWACSAVGAYLSPDRICYPNTMDTVIHYTPQIENPLTHFLTDKVNWAPISGEFSAEGGESFITIGNFYSSPEYFDSVGHGGLIWRQPYPSAYYYIDDVYVRMLTIANAGKNDSICAGGSVMIGKDTTTIGVSFSWQPTTSLSNPNIAEPIASPTVTTTYTLTVTNDSIHNCNCADSVTRDSVVINVCTGINELSNKISSKIYPDPNNGIFTLSLSKVYNIPISNENEIEIYDVFGRIVFTSTLPPPNGGGVSFTSKINISSQPSGVYFYKIFSPDGVSLASGKFAVVK